MIHRYCKLCQLCRPGEPGCHGRRFKNFQVNPPRDGLNAGAYVPLSVEEKFYQIEKIYGRGIRQILPIDANSTETTLAVFEYSGKGSRKTLTALHIWKAEIGQVGKLYADIFLKKCLDDPNQSPRPIRRARNGHQIYIIK